MLWNAIDWNVSVVVRFLSNYELFAFTRITFRETPSAGRVVEGTNVIKGTSAITIGHKCNKGHKCNNNWSQM